MYRSFPANRAMKPLTSVAPLERERGELQRGDPPLGAFLQDRDVLRGEVAGPSLR